MHERASFHKVLEIRVLLCVAEGESCVVGTYSKGFCVARKEIVASVKAFELRALCCRDMEENWPDVDCVAILCCGRKESDSWCCIASV